MNAVSDVYAMGGRPLLALNIVAWNTAELPMELLGDVLAGRMPSHGKPGSSSSAGTRSTTRAQVRPGGRR
jgi:selenophosphate synthase